MIFHGIAVKPGKPTVFGQVGGKPVLGMPGYPDVVPVERLHARSSRCCAGWRGCPSIVPHSRPRAARAADRVDHRPAPVLHGAHRRRRRGAGVQGSGDITSMAHADGYIEIPAQTDIVEAGELVEVKLF